MKKKTDGEITQFVFQGIENENKPEVSVISNEVKEKLATSMEKSYCYTISIGQQIDDSFMKNTIDHKNIENRGKNLNTEVSEVSENSVANDDKRITEETKPSPIKNVKESGNK